MPKRSTDYRSALLEDLRDPVETAHYLNAALGDSEEMFLLALRDVAEARQIANVAERAGISRESVYRMLSPAGNPTYRNLIGILRAVEVEFAEVRALSRQDRSKLTATPPVRARKPEALQRTKPTLAERIGRKPLSKKRRTT
ncbi:MAG: addiction module antidote protein [Bryobacteraceae bacterium]